jgi:alpha-L-rhamnosidase
MNPSILMIIGYALVALSLAFVPAFAFNRAAAQNLTIATFGTSLTQRGGWQAPLREEMRVCLDRPIRVTNRAKSGETSRWGLRNIDAVLADEPDIILIEFAVNDASLNRLVGLSRSIENMRAIIAAFRARNKDVIIVVQAMNPIWGIRRWIRPFLDDYRNAHARLAQELGVGFLDHRPIWAVFPEDEIKRIIPDGAHPLPDFSARMIAGHIKDWLIAHHFKGRCG